MNKGHSSANKSVKFFWSYAALVNESNSVVFKPGVKPEILGASTVTSFKRNTESKTACCAKAEPARKQERKNSRNKYLFCMVSDFVITAFRNASEIEQQKKTGSGKIPASNRLLLQSTKASSIRNRQVS